MCIVRWYNTMALVQHNGVVVPVLVHCGMYMPGTGTLWYVHDDRYWYTMVLWSTLVDQSEPVDTMSLVYMAGTGTLR